VDAGRGFALLSWVDGAQVDRIGDADIDAAVTFLAAIHDLRTTPWALEQPLAAEACLCGSEIVSQVEGRFRRLQDLPERDPDLIDFLDNSFASTFAEAVTQSRRELGSAGLDFELELPQKWRSLVPSDFGFHNSLRRGDGSLAFLDFEYFGWDDPVKLTADILLHPGRDLMPSLRRRFRTAAVSLYQEDRNFQTRLSAFLPLFGLRWVLILLNEFIPERWRRRVLAGATESWSEAKSHQLKFVRSFLASLSRKVEE
jgi:Phosphotransferase enzyme family